MECFFARLQDKVVEESKEDKVCWVDTKSGTFFVKSLYASLKTGRVVQFPSSVVWNAWVPPKVCFFAWEATWGKALTLDQLQRRGWSLANRCFLSLSHEESIDHILLHCDKARVLWDLLFSLFRVFWVMQSTVREAMLSWHGSFVGRKRKKVWRAAPLCIFWTIWKEKWKIF